MATKKAKKITKKITKKVTNKQNKSVDFKDSYYKIKDTAKFVNNQVKETIADVVEDVRENSDQIQEVAVKRVKATMNKVSDAMTLENITKTTKAVNNFTLKTAESLLEDSLENGEKWQAVGKKAIKGSLKLAAKQQDIVFDTLETVKGQLISNAGRFKKLFSKN